jgi:proline iminopeptidase
MKGLIMKKGLLIALLVIFILAAITAATFWYATGAPMYTPGKIREQMAPFTSAAKPDSIDPDYWQVEPDIRLYHFSHGAGRNVLVIHGGPGIPFRQPLSGLASLEGDYLFHYYDQRGCGKSTRPFDRFESPNTYENMGTLEKKLGLGAQVADIERIRQILGEEQLILIGHSWGGFQAALYAAEFPEHVQALVLVSPATMLVMPQEETDLFGSVRDKLSVEEQAEFDAFMDSYFDFNGLFHKSEADLVAMQAQFGGYYSLAIDTDLTEIEQGQPGGWMAWAQYLSLGQRHDYRPALREVSVPVLVLHGANDLQSESASRMYSETFPNAQFAVIPSAGHFSFEEQPKTFERLVADFLAGLE